MSSGPEKKVKDALKLILKAKFNAYFFMPVQMGMGADTLDFLCCIDGFFVGIETKAPGKEPSPRQNLRMQEIEKAGGIALWGDNATSIADTLWIKLTHKKNVLRTDAQGADLQRA